MFIDSHCHILSEEFEIDREDCLKRAFDSGVTMILDASGGVNYDKLMETAEFCRTHQNVYVSVGVHPDDAEKFPDITADKIVKMCNGSHIVGIGECGLDYYYNSDTRYIQLKVFLEQIYAAQKTKLPLIIHSREADDDMIKILAQEYEKAKFSGVLHCFSSTRKLAEFALEIGFYISASGIITFNKSDDLRNIFADIPLDKLLIETDAPYLAPTPFRGKRNEPAFVVKTAEKLAEIKGLSTKQIAQITSNNFQKLFIK